MSFGLCRDCEYRSLYLTREEGNVHGCGHPNPTIRTDLLPESFGCNFSRAKEPEKKECGCGDLERRITSIEDHLGL